jgi:hypothetical protein
VAATTTAVATELIYAKILTDMLIDNMYGVAVMDQLVRQESLVGKPSNSFSFPVWPALTAASIAETADLTSSAVDTTNVDIAVTEAASIRVDVTDLLIESAILTDGMRFAEQGGKAVADKRDTDLAALCASFTTVVGTTTVVLSEANVLKAITTLHGLDAPQPYVVALHPFAIGDLRKALATTTAVVQTARGGGDASLAPGVGFEFSYFGVDIYGSTNIPTANAAADVKGAIFSKGQALARVDKRPIRVEPQRDASLRATEYNISSVYGQGILVQNWGVAVLSKNAAS